MEYLTISEFAKMRDLNINSLRYFEKLGILKPAKIDEANKYRYYTINQLIQLDQILLFTDLGVPLRELPLFLNEDGSFQTKKLLKYGKKKFEEELQIIQNKMDRINRVFEYYERTKDFGQRETAAVYSRKIPSRQVLIAKAPVAHVYSIVMETAVAEIYRSAKERGLLPLFPTGIILDFFDGRETDRRLFVNVVGNSEGLENVQEIPAGEYRCAQIVLRDDMDVMPEIRARFGEIESEQIIIEHMIKEVSSKHTNMCEVQLMHSSLSV